MSMPPTVFILLSNRNNNKKKRKRTRKTLRQNTNSAVFRAKATTYGNSSFQLSTLEHCQLFRAFFKSEKCRYYYNFNELINIE